MKKILPGIGILFLITSIGYCQEPKQSLQLTIKSDKQVYEVGEEINLELSVKNVGKKSTKVYSPEYWGVSEIFVKNSKGSIIQSRFIGKASRLLSDVFCNVPAGNTQSFFFKNLQWFGCGGLIGFDLKKDFSPGICTIYMTIKNPPACVGAKYLATDLTGTLTSNAITIEMREGAADPIERLTAKKSGPFLYNIKYL